MLDMARVGKDDVVYDLGSGDGRLIITAAKNMAPAASVLISTRNASPSRGKTRESRA